MQTQKYAFIHRYRESQAERLVEKSLKMGKRRIKKENNEHLYHICSIKCPFFVGEL